MQMQYMDVHCLLKLLLSMFCRCHAESLFFLLQDTAADQQE